MGPVWGAENDGRTGGMEESARSSATRKPSSCHAPAYTTPAKHVAIQYERSSRSLHARSIACDFAQRDKPTKTTFSCCHAAPKPFSRERSWEQPRGRTTCHKKPNNELATVCGEPADSCRVLSSCRRSWTRHSRRPRQRITV